MRRVQKKEAGASNIGHREPAVSWSVARRATATAASSILDLDHRRNLGLIKAAGVRLSPMKVEVHLPRGLVISGSRSQKALFRAGGHGAHPAHRWGGALPATSAALRDALATTTTPTHLHGEFREHD